MRKWMLIVMAIVLVAANFSASITYSLRIEGYDPSARHTPTYFHRISLDNDLFGITIKDGEILKINGKVHGMIQQRNEIGWIYYPVKAKPSLEVKIKKADPAVKAKENLNLLVLMGIVGQRRIYPDIPLAFADNRAPANFINNINGWAFSKEELEKNPGQLLTLDLDFGKRCSLNCPHCFRKSNKADLAGGKEMGYDDIVNVVKQAKELGCKSVKFLGAGEPFETPRILDFLRVLKELKITPLVFTKGHVLGNDALVKKLYKDYGISSGEQLVAELDRLGVTFLLGFNSFAPEVQNKMVGGIIGYTEKRNRALKLLCEAGLNKTNPTRIGLIVTPITVESYNEIYKIYCWGKLRNLGVVTCPTMVSGRCGDEETWREITPPVQELVDLYTKIYEFNLQYRFQTMEQIKEEGISSYAGFHPCNQVSCGMYVTLNGTVLRCPGDDTTIFGSIWENPLDAIWHSSENYWRKGQFNCNCPPKDGKSIPHNLYTRVMQNLLT